MGRPTHCIRYAAVLISAVLSTGCISSTPTTAPASTDEPSATSFISVYTHCGVENVRIDGRWWHASPPLYNQEGSGPPAEWGDPYQEGVLTMESADRAVFEARGQRVVFVPASDNEPVRVCR